MLRRIAYILSTFLLLLAAPHLALHAEPPRHEPHRRRVADRRLPPDARDIRWVLPPPTYPNTVYDFSTSEAEFHVWARRVGPDLEGPVDGPTTITVGNLADGTLGEHEIADGVHYEWYEQDRGTYRAYDRDNPPRVLLQPFALSQSLRRHTHPAHST